MLPETLVSSTPSPGLWDRRLGKNLTPSDFQTNKLSISASKTSSFSLQKQLGLLAIQALDIGRMDLGGGEL